MNIATLAFYIRQIVLLGSVGFAVFILYGWWATGPVWASDIWVVWLIALFAVGAYLVVVGAPVQLICNRFHLQHWALVFGLISGSLAVLCYQLLFFDASVTLHNYVVRMWLYHFAFSLVGFWFSYNFQKHVSLLNSTRLTQGL